MDGYFSMHRSNSRSVSGTFRAAAQEKGHPQEPPSQNASPTDRNSYRAASERSVPRAGPASGSHPLSLYGTRHLRIRISDSGHLPGIAECRAHLMTRAVSDPVRLAEWATEKLRHSATRPPRSVRSRPRPPAPDLSLPLASSFPWPLLFSSVDLSFWKAGAARSYTCDAFSNSTPGAQ